MKCACSLLDFVDQERHAACHRRALDEHLVAARDAAVWIAEQREAEAEYEGEQMAEREAETKAD